MVKLASLRRNFGSFVGDRFRGAPVQGGCFSAHPSVLHSADPGIQNLLDVCECVRESVGVRCGRGDPPFGGSRV